MGNMRIVSLDDAGGMQCRSVGAKTLGLARLKGIGLSVPGGFCVTTEAFDEHIKANGLDLHITAAMEGLTDKSVEDRSRVLADMRRLVVEAPFVGEFADELQRHFAGLGAIRAAVRSSATAEDTPAHSFAGQYDTVLGVRDYRECATAVRRCWASVWTQRAYEYRRRNNIEESGVKMAVIVQSLIEADVSGVIFTADVVTGDGDCIVIESCPGLGEGLVSGKVSPDRFVVAKDKCRVVSSTIASKSIRVVPDGGGATVEETLPEEMRTTASIDESTCRELARHAIQTEKAFGGPQDIEWAMREGKIYFLQARPVTTAVRQKTWEERQIWTNANTGEVFPDVLTPCTWSLIETILAEFLDRTMGIAAITRGSDLLFGLVAGRLYFNMNTAVGILRAMPLVRRMDFDRYFGGDQKRLSGLGRINISAADASSVRFHPLGFLLKAPGLMLRLLTFTRRRSERMMGGLEQKVRRYTAMDVEGARAEELFVSLQAEIYELRRTLVEARFGAVFLPVGLAAPLVLQKCCSRWFDDPDESLANRLLIGVGNMDSAEAGMELRQLAAAALGDSAVAEIIMSSGGWETVREELTRIPQGEQFLRAWDRFMGEHGHHCRGELEFYTPRWAERPDYILDIVRTYCASCGSGDPLADYRLRAQQRDELTQQCRKRLRNPLKRWLFNHLLLQARLFPVLRENAKSLLVRWILRWRRILIELGRVLHERGLLENPDDIFFLRLEEIEPVMRNKAAFAVRETVSSRRQEYDRNKELTPPPVVIGVFDPDDCNETSFDVGAKVLKGISASPGKVTGPARVILHASDDLVRGGEILVAPFTDPGWTPYFVNAAGIVMDMGGLLSHGSIIAREYGIPAVVNVGPATKTVKTGQTIQVDGDAGIVRILD